MTRTYSKEQLDAIIAGGLTGPAGPTGPSGAAGFTTTTASFTQPASAATVSVTVADTAWIAVGQYLFINGGGYYTVSSITDATHVVVANTGYTGNASAGATVASGAKVVPGGIQGAAGAAGGVTSFNSRTGVVVPASGDYSYSQISSAPAIASQAQADAGTDDATIMTPLKSSAASMLRINRTEVSVTGATTLTSTAFGKMHVCSGTSADYTVGLPAASGNAGKVIGFRMADALTKLVTLDANAAELIDGATTRVMWAQESAILLCDGTGWTKVAGKTRPMIAAMRETANQSIPTSTTTTLTMSVTDKDIGGMADLTNERINIRRAGTYFVVASMALAAGATATRIITSLAAGSLSTNTEMACTNTSMMPGPMCTTVADLAAGNNCNLSIWHDTGSSRNTGASIGTGTQPRLSAIEQITW